MGTTQDDDKQLADAVQIRLVHLKATSTGIVTGTIMAVGIFVATNWLVLKDGLDVGRHLKLLGEYFIGYTVTFVGSFVGAAYAFALGFLGGYAVARMYNMMTTRIRGSQSEN